MGKEQGAQSRGEQALDLPDDLPRSPHSSPGATL
jgi:hypothetical protein